MTRKSFRLALGTILFLMGALGLALGGIQAVADQQLNQMYVTSGVLSAFQSPIRNTMYAGGALISGVALLATLEKRG